MTRDEAVAIVKGRLARTNNSDITAYVVAEMKLQQSILEESEELPWFLLSETGTTTLTAGEERIQLPENFLLEWEDGALYVQETDGTWTPILKDDYDAIAGRKSGEDFRYSLAGNYFRILPTVTANKTLKMIYYAADTALSTDVENNWLKYAADLMIARTGIAVASYVKDYEALTLFTQDDARATRRLMMKNEARKHVNRDYAMGDD